MAHTAEFKFLFGTYFNSRWIKPNLVDVGVDWSKIYKSCVTEKTHGGSEHLWLNHRSSVPKIKIPFSGASKCSKWSSLLFPVPCSLFPVFVGRHLFSIIITSSRRTSLIPSFFSDCTRRSLIMELHSKCCKCNKNTEIYNCRVFVRGWFWFWLWLWLIPISVSIFLGGNFVIEFAVRMLRLGVIDSRALFEINLDSWIGCQLPVASGKFLVSSC